MKKKITKLRMWLLKKLMTKNDLRLMLLGADIVEDYTHNRSFRRKLKGTRYENICEGIIDQW